MGPAAVAFAVAFARRPAEPARSALRVYSRVSSGALTRRAHQLHWVGALVCPLPLFGGSPPVYPTASAAGGPGVL